MFINYDPKYDALLCMPNSFNDSEVDSSVMFLQSSERTVWFFYNTLWLEVTKTTCKRVVLPILLHGWNSLHGPWPSFLKDSSDCGLPL